jgi:predicted AlkP superfamily pyrophosphatase or phosphodiesterase
MKRFFFRFSQVRFTGALCFVQHSALSLIVAGCLFQSCTEKSSGKRLFEHVVVIGIDGLTGDGLKRAETPVLDGLIASGAVKYDVRTVLPTVSAPNWGAMLHGAGPEATGITSNDSKKWMQPVDASRNGRFPSIFDIIREQIPDAEQGAIFHWDGFGQLLQRETVNCYATYSSAEETARKICEYIVSKKPVFLFTQLDHVDAAGHTFGYTSGEYLTAVAKADSLAGHIMESIRQAGMADNTLVMVVSDHGGIGRGHGGETTEEASVPIIYYGKGIKKSCTVQQTVYMYDVAASIAFALNLKVPQAWTGRPSLSAFEF